MGTSRLNNRDRLYIRIANDGTAIANSALWRSQIPRSQGRWKDITECVVGCCSTTEPTEGSYLIVKGNYNLNGSSHITGIDFPGYHWTGSIGAHDLLVVPLPFNFNETITFTCLVTGADMDAIGTTIVGDGTITNSVYIPLDADPQTFTMDVTSTPGSQYLVTLIDD